MTTTQRDELQTAMRVVLDRGYDIVIKEQYARLRAWLDIVGWPPKDWPATGVAQKPYDGPWA